MGFADGDIEDEAAVRFLESWLDLFMVRVVYLCLDIGKWSTYALVTCSLAINSWNLIVGSCSLRTYSLGPTAR